MFSCEVELTRDDVRGRNKMYYPTLQAFPALRNPASVHLHELNHIIESSINIYTLHTTEPPTIGTAAAQWAAGTRTASARREQVPERYSASVLRSCSSCSALQHSIPAGQSESSCRPTKAPRTSPLTAPKPATHEQRRQSRHVPEHYVACQSAAL